MTDAANDEAPAALASSLRIVSRGATTEDIAAVTAVLTAALDELAGGLEPHGGSTLSGWRRSQRPIRAAIAPASGQWRSFTG